MKTFHEWLADNHPEMIDEGMLQDLANSKLARNLMAGAAITAGSLGLGARTASAATPRPVAVKASQEDQDDEDFIAGDVDPDVEIAQEKAKMLRDAAKLRQSASVDQKRGIVTTRGSGHMSGGKVVPSQKTIKKAVEAPQKKFDSARAKLPTLPGGPGQSPNLGGVE